MHVSLLQFPYQLQYSFFRVLDGPSLPAQSSTLTNEVELTPALVIVITYCYVTTEHRWSVFLLLQGLCWSPFLLLILLYGNDGHSFCVVPHSASQEPSILFRKSINIGKCGFSCKKNREKKSQPRRIHHLFTSKLSGFILEGLLLP